MRAIYDPSYVEEKERPRVLDFGSSEPRHRSVEQLLGNLTEESQSSQYLSYSPVGVFHHGQDLYRIPRYVFLGDVDGNNSLRLGLFAGIHGDEPEGSRAVMEFLRRLNRRPERAFGYELFAYPLCNPSGYEDDTHHSRAGVDLNHEFWNASRQPEVYYIERELGVFGFDGVIALHTGDENGIRLWSRSSIIRRFLLDSAIEAASEFLPRAAGNQPGRCSNSARPGHNCHEGVLANSSELPRAPFEVLIETPRSAPEPLHVEAAIAALDNILANYRAFLAQQQNI